PARPFGFGPTRRAATTGVAVSTLRFLTTTHQLLVKRPRERIFTIHPWFAQASRPHSPPVRAPCHRSQRARAHRDRTVRAPGTAGASARPDLPPLTTAGFLRAPRAEPRYRDASRDTSRMRV